MAYCLVHRKPGASDLSSHLRGLHNFGHDHQQHAQRGRPAALCCLAGVSALQIASKADKHHTRLQEENGGTGVHILAVRHLSLVFQP